AVTQLVDRLVEHGMVERRPDERDRRVVLVDYVPKMREVARSITYAYRSHLEDLVKDMNDEEMRAFLKGIKLLAAGAEKLEGSINRATERGGEY
ncbi:MAG: MarR family transcriptional regulator, partial [Rubrobacter sp.]